MAFVSFGRIYGERREKFRECEGEQGRFVGFCRTVYDQFAIGVIVSQMYVPAHPAHYPSSQYLHLSWLEFDPPCLPFTLINIFRGVYLATVIAKRLCITNNPPVKISPSTIEEQDVAAFVLLVDSTLFVVRDQKICSFCIVFSFSNSIHIVASAFPAKYQYPFTHKHSKLTYKTKNLNLTNLPNV